MRNLLLGTTATVAVLWIVAATHPLLPSAVAASPSKQLAPQRHTIVSIRGDDFYVNDQPTYAGRSWKGNRIEGLLLNSRMVQGIFDDLNPETARRWTYADTHAWDAERNTSEFIAAMPEWKRNGLIAFTLNLQGGSPEGYSHGQPWINSAFEPDGSLRADYLARLTRILDRADEMGMVVILGFFYQAQDRVLVDEAAVNRAVDNAAHWLLDHGYRNVLVEVNNECDQHYKNEILGPKRVHEVIARVRGIERGGVHLLAGTSYAGGLPSEAVVLASDFLLLHGNGKSPEKIVDNVRRVRAMCGPTPKPIVINEDDHYDFDKPSNNYVAVIREHASWGYFDYGRKGEAIEEGFQCIPVNWTISSDRKRAFFKLTAEISGAAGQ
jgi:hypothetical protein